MQTSIRRRNSLFEKNVFLFINIHTHQTHKSDLFGHYTLLYTLLDSCGVFVEQSSCISSIHFIRLIHIGWNAVDVDLHHFINVCRMYKSIWEYISFISLYLRPAVSLCFLHFLCVYIYLVQTRSLNMCICVCIYILSFVCFCLVILRNEKWSKKKNTRNALVID